MNRNRIIAGGVVAGALVWIGGELTRAYVQIAVPYAPAHFTPVPVQIIRCITLGLIAVLLYALIIPRQGKGRSTALTAGLLVLIAGGVFPPLEALMGGTYPSRGLLIYMIANCVIIPFATVIGCSFYREEEQKSLEPVPG